MAADRRAVAGFWRDAAVRSSGHSVGDPYGRGFLVFYGFGLWHLGAGYRYLGENLVGGAQCPIARCAPRRSLRKPHNQQQWLCHGRSVEGAVHSVAEEGKRFYTEKWEERRR